MNKIKIITRWTVLIALMAIPALSLGSSTMPADKFPINIPESVNLPSGGGLSLAEIKTLIITIANWLMILGVIVAVLFLAWGSIRWITARGDTNSLKTAQAIIRNGIIGLIVLFGIGVILRTAAGLISRTFFI